VVTLYVVVISSHKATFSTFLNFMNFILFQLMFLKFKSKIKFIKFELHNYAVYPTFLNLTSLFTRLPVASTAVLARPVRSRPIPCFTVSRIKLDSLMQTVLHFAAVRPTSAKQIQ